MNDLMKPVDEIFYYQQLLVEQFLKKKENYIRSDVFRVFLGIPLPAKHVVLQRLQHTH